MTFRPCLLAILTAATAILSGDCAVFMNDNRKDARIGHRAAVGAPWAPSATPDLTYQGTKPFK